MDKKLIDKISKRKEEGTLRSLSFLEGKIDFYSNDYLGFSKLKTAENNVTHGSTGSRLLSGNSIEAINCEKTLAQFFKSEAALLFNSGYDANLGLFSAVPQRGDTVLYDENIHASVRDGIRLSHAKAYSFAHNSVLDLKSKLVHSEGAVYIAVESLYSMDGDIAPLKQLVDIAEEHNAYLIVDDAHACGVFGERGRGLVDALNLNQRIFARVVTFGKAYGAHGACVLGDEDLTEFLINFARSFIYTTALPPQSVEHVCTTIQRNEVSIEQKKLHENIAHFRSQIDSDILISEINSPIQMIRLGNITSIKNFVNSLEKNGVSVKPIYSPTVKVGQEGLRICIHSFNSRLEINLLCSLINKVV